MLFMIKVAESINIKKMNKQRLGILIAAVVGMLAVFMPWANMPVGSISGMDGSDGWVVLVLFAIPLVVSLLKDRSQPVRGGLLWVATVPGILVAVLGIWKVARFNEAIGDAGAIAEALGVGIGFGLYLTILAGLAVPLVAFLLKGRGPSVVSGQGQDQQGQQDQPLA
jgi:hypothetical protein